MDFLDKRVQKNKQKEQQSFQAHSEEKTEMQEWDFLNLEDEEVRDGEVKPEDLNNGVSSDTGLSEKTEYEGSIKNIMIEESEFDDSISDYHLEEDVQEDFFEEVQKGLQKEIQGDSSKEIQKGLQKEIRGDSSKEIQKGLQKEIQGDSSKEIQKDSQKDIQRDSQKEIQEDLQWNSEDEWNSEETQLSNHEKTKLRLLYEIAERLDILEDMDIDINHTKKIIQENINLDLQTLHDSLKEEVHEDAIKTYRNIQAVIVEEDAKQNHILFGVDGNQDKLKKRMNHVMIFSVISFVTSILVMLLQILPALGIQLF